MELFSLVSFTRLGYNCGQTGVHYDHKQTLTVHKQWFSGTFNDAIALDFLYFFVSSSDVNPS